MGNPERTRLWIRGRPVYDEAGFIQAWTGWNSGMIAAKFVVESASQPIGLVVDYERTLDDCSTKMAALLCESNIGRGGGAIATALFWTWLFESLPLRKIYLDVVSYNPLVIRIFRRLGLAAEGVLKADRFWNGADWDLDIFALYREAGRADCDCVFRSKARRRPAMAAAVCPAGASNGSAVLAEKGAAVATCSRSVFGRANCPRQRAR
jgi:hypothetical protein